MQVAQFLRSSSSHARGQGFKWAFLPLLLLFVLSGTHAFAATTLNTANLGANQVTLQITSDTGGLASLTVLQGGATCGSPAQTAAGKDNSGTAAFRIGSLTLAAGTTGNYTVRNLVQSTAYTACVAAADGAVASTSVTTNAAVVIPYRYDWELAGATNFTDTDDRANYESLAFAPDGTLYVAYQDSNLLTTVKKLSGTNWVTVGSAGFGSPTALGTASLAYQSLAFAPDGTPYVAFSVAYPCSLSFGHCALYPTVMKFNGTDWVQVGSPTVPAPYQGAYRPNVSLAFAPDGTPYVAYQDSSYEGDSTAGVIKFDGTNWVPVGPVGFTQYTAELTTLAFAPNGTPYLAYYDASAQKAAVMKFDGSNWSKVGAASLPVTYELYGLSFAFAPDGTPHLIYTDRYYAGTYLLKYDGTNWVQRGGTRALTGLDQMSTAADSLAFGPDGNPYFAFLDPYNNLTTTVGKYDGSNWNSAGTAVGGSSGVHNSLAIGPDGTPYLAASWGASTVYGVVYKLAQVPPTIYSEGYGVTTAFTGSPWAVVGTNSDDTTVTFEYGLTGALGSTVAAATNGTIAGTTFSAVSTAQITGLTPSTTYYFRADATNSGGTTQGSLKSFTTSAAPVASKLAFTTAPAATIAQGGNAGTVVVADEDSSNNLVPTTTNSITLTVTGPSGYTQAQTVAASGGVATFDLSSIALPTPGTYTYTATSGGLTQATATETVAGSSYTAPTGSTGTTGGVQSVTIVFSSSTTLNSNLATAIQVLTQGAPNLDFAYATGGTCTAGTTYAAGQSCTVNYTFTPKYPGQRLGAIVLFDNSAPPVPVVTIHLSGMGTGPMVTFPSNTAVIPVGSGLIYPVSTAVDGTGSIFVVDAKAGSVKKIVAVNGVVSAASSVVTVASGFTTPLGVAVDGAGNLFVTDFRANTLSEVVAVNGGVSSSSPVKILATGLAFPWGVAVDASGNVFVGDSSNGAVKEIVAGSDGTVNASSTVITMTSGMGIPYGVAVDASGNVFVTDMSRVEEIVAGTGGAAPGTVNASSTVRPILSGFSQPTSVAVDANGNLFVGDDGNSTVKEIVASGGVVSPSSTVNTIFSGVSFSCVSMDASGNLFITGGAPGTISELPLASAPSVSFANTATGSTSSPKTVTVANSGNASLSISKPGSGNNPSIATGFTLDSTGATACPLVTPSSASAGTLLANATCTLPITFAPTDPTPASYSGLLNLTDNSLNVAGTTQAISLSGTSVPPVSQLGFGALPAASVALNGNAGVVTVDELNTSSQIVTTANDAITLTVTGPSGYLKTYGPTPATSGVASFDLSGVSLTTAGSYSYTATTASLSTATFRETVNQASQTITFAPSSPVVYGASPITLSATGGNSGNAVTFTYVSGPGSLNGNVLTVTGAGTIKIAADQAGTTNYTAATEVVASIVVNPASLTVTVNPATSVYGVAFPAFTGTVSGVVPGDGITASYSTTATPTSAAGGSYSITATLNDPNQKLGNYSVVNTPAALSITKALLIVAVNSATSVYGVAFPVFTGTVSGVVPGDGITATYSTTATTTSGVGGIYVITATLNDPNQKLGNYSVLKTPAPLSITRASLSIAVNPATSVYGAAFPAFTGTLSGVVPGDGITATYSTTATPTSAVGGSYTITATLNDPNQKLANYTVTNTPAALTITKAPLTVTVNPASSVYGAAFPAFTGTVSGAVAADGITATYSTTATTTSAVGGSYSITATLNDPNSKLGNYTVTNTPAALTIGTAALTVTVNPASSVYGAAFPAFTGTVSGVVAGDGITATYSTTATTTSAVGGSYSITATLNDPNSKLGNYTVTNTPAALTITKATPKVSVTSNSNPVLVQNAITLTATVSSSASTPTGSVTFLDGATSLGTGTVNASGVTTLTLSTLSVGSHSITAAYAGDTNFTALTSSALAQSVQDFNLTITTSGSGGTAGVTSVTALPGGTAVYTFTLSPVGSTTFPAIVTLSASGLPTGATYSFSPATIAAGAGSTQVTLTVQLPQVSAMNMPPAVGNTAGPSVLAQNKPASKLPLLALALLLLPFSGRMRRASRKFGRVLPLLVLLLAGLAAIAGLSGCGSSAGYFGQAPANYTISVTGTSGALTHSTSVTLTVE